MDVLILSKSTKLYSTARLAESAKAIGFNPLVADYSFIRLSTFNALPSHHHIDFSNVGALIPRIAAPFSQTGAMVISQFEKNGVFSVTGASGLLYSRNKFQSLQLLQQADIPVPKSLLPEYNPYFKQIVQELGGYPVIIKALVGTHGEGIYLVKNEKELRNIIRFLKGMGERFLLQTFIAESSGTDIRCFVVGDKVVASMKRVSKKGEFRSNLHVGGSGFAYEITPNIEQIAVKACRVLGLTIGGVDILLSNTGPMVIEVNASPGLEGIEKATNVDVAGAILGFIQDKTKKE